jgi:hypothetical protein
LHWNLNSVEMSLNAIFHTKYPSQFSLDITWFHCWLSSCKEVSRIYRW